MEPNDNAWQRTGTHCMERAPWIVTKYLVCGVPRYALWRGNASCGYFDSAAGAMEEADRLAAANSRTAATDTSPTRISNSNQTAAGIGVRP